MSLIQTLPPTKLDIVGDVHGEFEAFQNLLHYLGYNPYGKHPQGRRLVFVGDLVDRGHDTPAMLDWFAEANRSGHAFTVLGNHELNLLLEEPKDGSGWFFGHRADKDDALYAPWNKLPAGRQNAVEQLISEQPLILERTDLRIVHAAWLPESIAKIREHNNRRPTDLYHEWENEIHCCLRHAPWYDDYLAEQRIHAHDLENPNITPPHLCATAEHDIYRSRANPIRAITCGVETHTETPFFAGGRWRFTVRNPWWNGYTETCAVIIGHYWRQWQAHARTPKHRRELFTVPPYHWHGQNQNVFCCDFSVGARWRDRKYRIAPSASKHRLAAMRWPEKTLVFDNGETVASKTR